MVKKWLFRLGYDSPQLVKTDPKRAKFELDKQRIDKYFSFHGYKILCIDINRGRSFQIPNEEVYVLGGDFFHYLKTKRKGSYYHHVSSDPQDHVLLASDTIVMTLKCMKDVVQEIGGTFYVNPYASRFKAFLKRMGFRVESEAVISEGGLFLQGNPPAGEPFLVVSYEFLQHFEGLNIPLLRSPPCIDMEGRNPLTQDSHIDTYLGLINFREGLEISGATYNGILYIHTDSLKFVSQDPKKHEVWDQLSSELKARNYLIREYTPTTPAQNIGINFKFDIKNHTLLTNAFPKTERIFLENLGITILAPEYDFSTNDSFSGGINCSYVLVPHNDYLQTAILGWIINQKGEKNPNQD